MSNKRTIGWGVLRIKDRYLWTDIVDTKKHANDIILRTFKNERAFPEDVEMLGQWARDSELKRIWRQKGLCAVQVELVMYEP